jgi:hypothetical protein
VGPELVRQALAEADQTLKTRGRPWPRLALEALAIVVLATAWLAVYGQADAGAGFLGVTPVVLAKDGIPVQVNGERVYRIGESATWKQLTGSFLLAGWFKIPYSWTPWELDYRYLAPYSGDPGTSGSGGDSLPITPPTSTAFDRWMNDLVVASVHNAAPDEPCTAEWVRLCGQPLVDVVVWPAIPTSVGAEHVYRAADSAQFEKLGRSFLMGGVVGLDSFCDEPNGCPAVDGRGLSSTGAIDLNPGEIAVVRVHLDSDLKWACPLPAGRPECVLPLALDEVVGTYDPYSPPYAVAAPPAPTGPILQVGPDGIPIVVDGQPVFRRTSLPLLSEFLLGGKLVRDPSCPSAAASPVGVAQIPDCGVWTVDGVAIRVLVTIPESLDGRTVVVRVVRAGGSGELVLTDIVVGG